MKMFWLGIALIIIASVAECWIFYELGYRAGLADGKNRCVPGFQSQHTKADSILKANQNQQ